MKCSRHQCVLAFIAAFEQLPPDERQEIVGEMASFCLGYREGTEDLDSEMYADADGAPQVQSENGAATLAATMTEYDVKPHRGRQGGLAPSPKGWA